MTRRLAQVVALVITTSLWGVLTVAAAPHASVVDGAALPVRAVVAKARVVSAEDLRRIGVRHWEPARTSVSAEGDNEGDEGERLDELFPPGAGTGMLPPSRGVRSVSPTGSQQTQSFNYLPGSSYDFDGPVYGAWFPADPAIAAGPSGLVLATNITITFCDANGNATYSDSLRSLLGSGSNFRSLFDPKVVYDEGAQRFYLTALTYDAPGNDSELLLAISKTSDANAGWYVYSLRVDQGNMAMDYEDIGYGPRAVYIGGNYVTGFINGPVTTSHANLVLVLDKTALLTGASVTYYQLTDIVAMDNVYGNTIRCAQMGATPPTGLDGFLVESQVRASTPNNLTLVVWGVSLPANFPSSGPSLDRRSVDTDFPGYPPDAVQKGGVKPIWSSKVSANLLDAQYRVGDIDVSATLGSGGRALARGIGIRVLSWPTLTRDWQDDRSSTTNSYFFPGIAANAFGDAVVSLGYSGSTVYGSMRAAVRPKDDPYWYSDVDIHDGDAYYNITNTTTQQRWGDYGGAAVDPVGQNFWVFHMYASTDAALNSIWKTRVGYIPRAVFVDVAAAGAQTGSILFPWQSLSTAVGDVRPGNDLVIKAGTYPAGVTLSTPGRVLPDGGTVQIGP